MKNVFRSGRTLLCFGCMMIVLTACEKSKSSKDVNVTGNWTMTISLKKNGQTETVALDMTLLQENGTVSGTTHWGPITGTVSGNTIVFTIDFPTGNIEGSGKADELVMSGTWKRLKDNSEGTFIAQRE